VWLKGQWEDRGEEKTMERGKKRVPRTPEKFKGEGKPVKNGIIPRREKERTMESSARRGGFGYNWGERSDWEKRWKTEKRGKGSVNQMGLRHTVS